MASWYYSVGGKAEGPVGDEFLLEGLKSGRFTLVDLVFREGDASWCTLGEIPEFREAFQALPLPVSAHKTSSPTSTVDEWNHDAEDGAPAREAGAFALDVDSPKHPAWVILKKKENGFEQIGPFSAEQIIEGLAIGEFEYSQYAWKNGYKRWVRIGNLPEFDRRKRDRDGDPVNQIIPLPNESAPFPALSQEELMESVVRFDRTQVIPTALLKELPPEDAAGEDLLSSEDFSIVMPSPAKAMPFPSSPVNEVEAPVPPPALASFDQDQNQDQDEVTEIPHLMSQKAEPVSVPVPPSIPSHSRVAPPIPPPLEPSVKRMAEAEEQLQDDLTPTQAVHPISSDSPSGVIPAEALALDVHGSQAEESASIEEAHREKVPVWKRAARLFVAGAAVGVLVVVALPYFLPGEEGEDAAQEASESTDQPSTNEASEEIRSAPGGKSPPDQGASTPVGDSGHSMAAGINGDPNLALPAAGGMESQAGVAVEPAGGAASAPAMSAEPVIAPPASKSAKRVPEALAGLQAVAPGSGAPTSLEIVPVLLTSQTPFIAIQSNAAIGQKIWVRIKARSGEILRLPSYDRTISIVREADRIPAVDLSSLNLPRGSYRVDVASGDLRKTAQIFLGQREGFDAEMEKHLKAMAFQQQNEKKTLFYTAKKFEGLAQVLSDNFQKSRLQGAKWKGFYSTWRKDMKTASEGLMSLAEKNASSVFAYPDEVKSLRAAIENLGEQARLLDVAVQQQRDVASQKPLAIIREFTRIRQEIALISSRK